jgi:hypothetical protein
MAEHRSPTIRVNVRVRQSTASICGISRIAPKLFATMVVNRIFSETNVNVMQSLVVNFVIFA